MHAIKSSDRNSTTNICDKMDDIKKTGYLKKLKTMKKKYFILRVESESGPPRLEYYDSEKKWRAGNPPKRLINLKTCFNINRKLDTKQKFVIALYTKDDSFAISLDNEAELEDWLTALLQLQHGEEYLGSNEIPKPNFEHVWQVNVKSRGLGSSKNILGAYRLCLTERTLSLVQMSSKEADVFEFPLVSIRRCGNSDSFFFMEVGRSAMTGAGELWMLTEDTLIAQNMHETILNAMKCSHKDDVAPRQRTRSSSANEASKPISVHSRRQQTNPIPAHITCRERADSMPTRPRTVSDGPRDGNIKAMQSYRPKSMSAQGMPSSPPYGFTPMSSRNYPGNSADNSLSMDDCDSSQPDLLLHHSLPEDGPMEPTTEEDMSHEDSYMLMTSCEGELKRDVDDVDGYLEMDPSVGLGSSQTPPHSRDASLTSPPSWLPLGSSPGRMASSPPTLAQPSSSHGSDYLEMTSPVGASTAGTLDGYMPMSPVGPQYMSAAAALTAKQISPSSAEKVEKNKGSMSETSNGYVPMAPVKEILPGIFKGHSPQDDEGYMDMNPSLHSNSKKINSEAKKSEDASRRSSGTPSTDMSFAEYPLDKVRAYFTPTDEDEPIIRAYSIGSRTDCERRNKLQVSSDDSSRTRAFSVGSKVGVKFGSKLSSGAGGVGSTVPKATAEERGKKSFSAPVLGTSPLCNSWSGTSFLHRMHSTSRSSNANEDLMEMDFPEGNNRGSGNVGQGFGPDGGRKGGAVSSGSSTDSLRRTPTGNRPRSNSRSSHSRPGKLETLQSIGEKSSSKSPPSEGIADAQRATPAYGDYAEMNHGMGTGSLKQAGKARQRDEDAETTATSPRSGNPTVEVSTGDSATTPTKQPTNLKPNSRIDPDYVNMNMNTGARVEKGASDRKRSLPVSIQGGRVKPSEASQVSGEYVSIDMSRGYSTSPVKFSHIPSSQQQQPHSGTVTVAGKVSSNPTYSSVRFPGVGGAGALAAPQANSHAPVPPLLKTEKRPNPDYANLQYGRRPGPSSPGVSAEATPPNAPTSMSTGAPANGLPRQTNSTYSDYAVMAPGLPASSVVPNTSAVAEASSISAKGSEAKSAVRTDVSLPGGEEPAESPELAAAATVEASANTAERQSSEAAQDVRGSRPSSVSGERELNYASLDLAAGGGTAGASAAEEAERSPRSPHEESANAALSYAKIDFAKSEGLRCANAAPNAAPVRENRV